MVTKLPPLPWAVPTFRENDPPHFVAPILANIVEAARLALEPTPTRVVYVNPGRQVPWDPEANCGLLAGRILGITPWTGPAGQPARPCGVNEWIVNMGISIIRCVATVNDAGDAPSATEMTLDGITMTTDEEILREVIRWHPKVRAMGAWNPLGNMGGLGGGEWTFTVRVPVCNDVPQRVQAAYAQLGLSL